MSLRITLELSEEDLKRFRKLARQARTAAEELSEARVVEAAKEVLAQVGKKKTDGGDFVSERLGKLNVLIDMLEDEGWALPDEDKRRVVTALTYFADPADLIPDHIPGLGFLDDAIMVELICRELKHEIEAYNDFCEFRQAEATRRGEDAARLGRADFLENRRKQLISRMRRRRRRDFGGGGGGGRSGRSPFSLF